MTTVTGERESEVVMNIRAAARILAASVHVPENKDMPCKIVFSDGKIYFFRQGSIDANLTGPASLVRDKWATDFYLREAGFKVPFSQQFRLEDIAQSQGYLEAVATLGTKMPIVLKPTQGSRGRNVHIAFSKEELADALRQIHEDEQDFVAQQYVSGEEYRILVLDGSFLAAFKREPAIVRGDGKNTIYDLIHLKQLEMIRLKWDASIDVRDPRIPRTIARQGLHLDDVPGKGQEVIIFDHANSGSGGRCTNISKVVNSDWRDLAVAIAKTFGLHVCGIDLIVSSPLCGPVKEYSILDVNSAPGFDYILEDAPRPFPDTVRTYVRVLQSIHQRL